MAAEALQPAHEVMVEELKKHCKDSGDTIKDKRVDDQIWTGINFAISAFCDAFARMFIPENELTKVIEQLESLRKHHTSIDSLIKKLEHRRSVIFKEVNSWVDCHIVLISDSILSISGTSDFNTKILPHVTYRSSNGGFTKQLHDHEHGDPPAQKIESKDLPYPVKQILTASGKISEEKIQLLFPVGKKVHFHRVRA